MDMDLPIALFLSKLSNVRLGFCINIRLILQALEPPIFSSEMSSLLRTGRNGQVKRAAGRLRFLPVMSSLQFARYIPPALDQPMRRYSQGTISLEKMGGSGAMESEHYYVQKT
jgi:hypothetical protein